MRMTLMGFLVISALMLSLSGSIGETSEKKPPTFIREGSSGSILYAIGGVGIEERRAMEAMAHNYNLKVVFALATGEYLSSVDVEIQDSKGRTQFHTRVDGPWLLAKLPPGTYTLIASDGDQTQRKSVTVGNTLSSVTFTWERAGPSK